MTPLCTLLKSGSDVLVQTFTVLVYRPSFLGYVRALHLQDQTLTMLHQSSMSPLVVYETKSKIIRHRQETYVLFTGSDLKDLKFQIQKFFYRQMYMSLATNKFFIVVTGNVKKDPKKVAKSVQLFMWYRHKLSNILVLIPNFNVSTLDVYTWLPFSSETQCNRQLDVVRVSQMTCDNFKHNSNEYLNDVSQNHKSFHGCAISVYTSVEDYVMTPHSSVDEIFYRENYETVLLKIIFLKLNLSYEFMPYLERKFHPYAINVCMGKAQSAGALACGSEVALRCGFDSLFG
ncbi:hypothetical protein ANN_10341 [Periplaneta americana]|uniref:Uncharacterized protein n=1 Tax=Periplaneta americana TaxID=6978 RepID=A0ABQ8TQC2_PERAM|nr:hypothetical protein ANN_10341 [Periplaneta americana]